ncbi:hypothetical protein PR048_028196 [Dryococelus australis]|uniref:Uncharacterized protein n=1 Tax=Dryococelus australis TaxID=614101 RepID=A0ABQ9GIL9_9NEOP|nr:hypothetical protein PR048_028196 [Dryococelus australis]
MEKEALVTVMRWMVFLRVLPPRLTDTPECKGRGNRRSQRKSAVQWQYLEPTCENLGVTQLGIEPGMPWCEVRRLTAQPPQTSLPVNNRPYLWTCSKLNIKRHHHIHAVRIWSTNAFSETPECKGRGNKRSQRIPAVQRHHLEPTCENLGVTQLGIEPGLPCWEVSRLTVLPPRTSFLPPFAVHHLAASDDFTAEQWELRVTTSASNIVLQISWCFHLLS